MTFAKGSKKMRKLLLLVLALVLCFSTAYGGAGDPDKLRGVTSANYLSVNPQKEAEGARSNTAIAMPLTAAQIRGAANAAGMGSLAVKTIIQRPGGESIWRTDRENSTNIIPIRPEKEELNQESTSRGITHTPDPNVILQGGDDIGSATVIPSLPYFDQGTTEGYADDYTEFCDGISYGITLDVVYSYTSQSDETVNISLCGTSFNTNLYVYDNGYTPGSPYACNDAPCGGNYQQDQIIGLALVAGHTYYIVVDANDEYEGSGPYQISVTPFSPTSYDFAVTAPGTWQDNTCGGADDCVLHPSPEHIYQVVIPSDGAWVFSLCSSTVDWNTWLFLGTEPCMSDIMQRGWPKESCPNSSGLYEITASLEAGTYYLTIEGRSSTDCGSYQLDISQGPTPPWNDHCEDVPPVELLPEGTLTFTGNTTGATSNGDYYFSGSPNVWHGFTINDTLNITVDYCTTPAYTMGPRIYLANGCPPAGITTAIEWTTFMCEGEDNWTMMFGALPPGTYYHPVSTDPWVSPGPYTLHVTGTSLPSNDNCAFVIPAPLVAESALTFTGDNRGATNDCPLLDGPEVWEAFSTTEPLRITIDYCGTSDFYSYYGILTSGCPCSESIQCNSYDFTSCGDDNITTYYWNLSAGTYYIPVLSDPGQAWGPYTIHISGEVPPPPPWNDQCQDVPLVDLLPGTPLTFNGDNTGATSTNDCSNFGPFANVWHGFSTYECMNITLDYCTTSPAFLNGWRNLAIGCPCADITSNGLVDEDYCGDGNATIIWTGLPAGTYYYPVLLDPPSGAGPGPYTIHVNGEACQPPPPNDDCMSAMVVGEIQRLPWSTSSATFDGQGFCMTSPNIWFSYTASASVPVTVSLCGSDFDTKLAVYDGDFCAPFPMMMIDCNDDFCELQSKITFDAIEGNPYKIEVGGYGSQNGDGVLTISVPAPHDVATVRIDSPRPGALLDGTPVDVIAVVKNTGLNMEMFDITAADNHGFLSTFTGLMIPPGVEQSVTFPNQWLGDSTCVDYSLAVATMLVGDMVTANDTVRATLNIPRQVAETFQYDDDIVNDAWYYYSEDNLAAVQYISDRRQEINYISARTHFDELTPMPWPDFTADPFKLYLFLDADLNGIPDAIPIFEEIVMPTGFSPSVSYAVLPCGVEVDAGQSFWVAFGNINDDFGSEGLAQDAEFTNPSMIWLRESGVWIQGVAPGQGHFGDDMLRAYTATAAGYLYLAGDANMYNEIVDLGNPLTGPWRVGGDVTFLVNFFDVSSGNQPCLMYNPNAPDEGQINNGHFFASADATGDCQVLGGDVSRLVQYFAGNPLGIVRWCGWDKPNPQNYYQPMWLSNRGSGLEQPVPPLEELPENWPNCQIAPPAVIKVIPGASSNR